MADYNIYIRAIGGGGSGFGTQTVPWSQRENGGGDAPITPQSGTPNVGAFAGTVMRASSFAQNPDSIVSAGVGTLAKALPWVAAAYACVKLGTSIEDNIIEFNEIESGDYSTGVAWSNFKNGIRVMFSPFSSAIQTAKSVSQWHRENKKNQAQRDLLGDSVINSYTRRGI